MDAAGDGDIVLVGPGTYAGGIVISGKSITLASGYHTTGDASLIESTVIKAPLSHVWHHIKLQNFSDWWTTLSKSEAISSQEETDVVKWTFKDGHELEVKQEEHSVRHPTLDGLCG